MVHLSLDMLVRPEQTREIVGALGALVRRARHDRGCLHADLCQVVDQPSRLFVRSEWNDEVALKRYVRSPDFTQLLAILDMAAEPPALEFTLGGTTRGLDYVAEIRAA